MEDTEKKEETREEKLRKWIEDIEKGDYESITIDRVNPIFNDVKQLLLDQAYDDLEKELNNNKQ